MPPRCQEILAAQELHASLLPGNNFCLGAPAKICGVDDCYILCTV